MTTPPDRLAQFRDEIREQRDPLPRPAADEDLVVHEADLVWFESAHNPARLAPVLASPMRTFELFLQDFEPGSASDMQRHHHEAVHYVLAGRGYSEIGDQRYPWAKGDFVSVPPMMWHRHYNESSTEPARMLIIENSRLLQSLGLNFRDSVGHLDYDELVRSGQAGPHTPSSAGEPS
jgi:gentisate 1,2-dioxygenase